MASTTQAAKQVSKALDSAAHKIIESTRVATGTQKARIDPQIPIQGKKREPGSNAFKEHEHRETMRLRKALDSVSHGKNIFVYTNVRTKQVVYSLTRYLQENNVLRQLIYHGKKTVPAELRRDMWAPYYSVHFSNSRLGLRAYQLLREFSMQRQLSPPPEMITVTEELLAAKRPKNPVEAEEFDKMNLKRIGKTMEKKERARVLMDQRATSVADIAAVVSIQDQAIADGFLERDGKRGYLTRKARQRRRAALKEAQEKAEENQAYVADLEARMSESQGEDVEIPEVVRILWRDVHDAQFAENWSKNVRHGQLQLSPDAQIMPMGVPEPANIEELEELEEMRQKEAAKAAKEPEKKKKLSFFS
ncbi:hypothetical protein N7468_001643 [Penicillium chermesinum]|uniref:Large ribosomal subunit protein mL67 n=1 Tax=Penicillium chermesinum TaxID=63820 RepID=A0A9W9PH65_9EURO|nr:uncharacterized protein N7468_001643 [Penicillium chermesinum]KAJ5246660.1 hypothetical protein N7468_001643 [Penicillium chermesinum]